MAGKSSLFAPSEPPSCKPVKPHKPLVLDDLLIQNMNTWGNVQYNIPLRLSSNETRTGTSIAHRYIPAIPHSMDCKIDDPLPDRVQGRDMVVASETYRTTTGEYSVKPNPNKANERSDCAINCRRVIFMTGVEKRVHHIRLVPSSEAYHTTSGDYSVKVNQSHVMDRYDRSKHCHHVNYFKEVEKWLQGKNITQPLMLSEMKDKYRGLKTSPLAPPDIEVKAPDPEYIFDVVAAGRNEIPSIPETSRGYRKLMDPYLSTYRTNHRPFSPDDQYWCKDHITFYTEAGTPKVRGFGPRHKEMWMPLTSKVHRGVYDRIHVKKEFKEVAAAHNPVRNLKGVFESETKKKFKKPYCVSQLASWTHGESFDLAPFQPNPYQTNIAPFMYCSDYCHIARGTPPYICIDQYAHQLPPHKACVQRHIVSQDIPL